MAIDPTAYGLTQWKAAIIAETTAGTILKTAMQLVNIDSPAAITRNPTLFTGMRSGDGRTAKAAEVYASEYGMEKSIQMSGLWDTTVGIVLLENVIGATTSTTIDVAANYTSEITLGAAALSDNIHTLSVVNIVPEGNNSEYYAGCVVDELKLTADTANDGGRFHFDTTLKTRGNAEVAAAPTTPTAFGTTTRSIYDFGAAASVISIATLGGAVDVILDSFELTFKSNVQWGGLGVNGVAQVINRGMPEFEVSGVFGVKFDANTVSSNVRYLAGTTVAVLCHSAATLVTGPGWTGSYGRITADVNPEDVRSGAYVKVPIKFLGHTSGNIFQIIV
uniref:Tail protein n=1 Tax=viral metagenome TaxID=1070528 RepID=A0A6M3KF46_9ZZZZ